MNYLGKTLGQITIQSVYKKFDGKRNRTYCLGVCSCGNPVDVYLYSLTSGDTLSCGCYHVSRSKSSKYNTTHGESKTYFYKKYVSINWRTSNPNDPWYGSKGIINEWKSFEEFKTDMYESYLEHVKMFGEKNTTIDRINSSGNYSKDNCRWATLDQQNNNKSSNKIVTFLGKSQTLKQWSVELGIKYSTIRSRISIGKDPLGNRI